MALTRLLLGIAAVLAWSLAVEAATHRLRPSGSAPFLGTAVRPLVAESVLLSLLAGLWFGSLGAGDAWLLFLLLGALMEVPGRMRSGTLAWKPVLAGLVRVVGSGVLLGWVMG